MATLPRGVEFPRATIIDTVVIDLADRSGVPADHYAIRHRPSGRFLAWDDTLTPRIAEALRYHTRAKADLRVGAIEPATRSEYEVCGLRYVPRTQPQGA